MSDPTEFLAGIPSRVRLSFAKYEPGEPAEHKGSVALSIDEPDPKYISVILEVSAPGWGFGEFTIRQTPKGVFIDTECGTKDQVKAALCALVDKAILDHETDPERHALYNAETGSTCGAGCLVCYPRGTPE